MKFKIDPLFFALVLATILLGQAVNFAWTLLALALHEAAHAAMARLRGYKIKQLALMPYGAMMSLGESFDPASAALIGLAGPAMNAVAALAILGIWWLAPAIYPFTMPFLAANVSLCLFNLLPAYPLDGARVVLGLCKNKLRAIKGLQAAGIVLSLAFFGLFVTSCFFEINFTFGIIAVFLFYGAAFGTNEEMYVSVLDGASKNLALGVEKKTVRISADAPIARLYHHVGAASITTFEVEYADGTARTVSEEELKGTAIKFRLSAPIGEALKGNAEKYGVRYPARRLSAPKKARKGRGGKSEKRV